MPVEFIVGGVVGAAAASQRVRSAVRRGLVYGVGGVLIAYDKLAAMAQSVKREAAGTPEKSCGTETNGSANGTSAAVPAAPVPSAAPSAGTPS